VSTPNNYSDKNEGETLVDHYAGLIVESKRNVKVCLAEFSGKDGSV